MTLLKWWRASADLPTRSSPAPGVRPITKPYEAPFVRRASSRAAGFTLIEMMVVVVVLGVLAAIAAVGYRKYIARARVGEAVAMLAEMVSKETLYQAEFAQFIPLRGDNDATFPSATELAAGFYPSDPTSADFESARRAVDIGNPALWPIGWRQVGMRPRGQSLYCTYLGNAGPAGTGPVGGMTYGAQLVPAAPLSGWFYALAVCNQTGAPGFPAGSSVFALTNATPTLVTFNDGQ